MQGALAATGTPASAIQKAWIGNFVGELFSNQGHLGAAVAGAHPDLLHKPIMRVEDKTFQKLTIPGGRLQGETGDPAIPTYTRLIAIPGDAAVQVRVTPVAKKNLTGIHLLPVQSEKEGAGFAYNTTM